MNGRAPITFEPAGITVWVPTGSTVLQAARQAGIVLAAPCGGRGVCGACGVRVLAGYLAEPDDEEARGLVRAGGRMRLACRARVVSPVTVRPIAVMDESHRPSIAGARACRPLVAGIDLGTTSVAAVLIDSSTGQEVGRASVANRQQSLGADVVSRMTAAVSGNGPELQRLAEQSIQSALEAAGSLAGCDLSGVDRAVVAGNSVMAALFVAADVTSLATYPFMPPMLPDELPSDAVERIGLVSSATIALTPPVAGFVGGDALAAIVAAGMLDAERPLLLVDFGTNAEIVMAGVPDAGMVVTSAAAGPAFEGMGISCGGPAAVGAVTRIRIADDGTAEFDVIGNGTPQWFSGSGLVSAIAQLRRFGHLDASGLLHPEGPLVTRFETDEDGVLGVSLGDSLRISQLDVRALQLAKAAVRAGIGRVLAAGGLGADDLERVYVAGAFGSALEPADLIELGILPATVQCSIDQVGNAALDGAALLALDASLLPLVKSAAARPCHVDLALDPEFNRALVAATELIRS